MIATNRVRRFIPMADALDSRLVPSTVEVCPMAPVLIDYRLPENNPVEVNPMTPLQVDTDMTLILTVNS